MEQQELARKILLYGRKLVEKDGQQYIDDKFTNFDSDILYAIDFKELEQGCELWLEGEKYPMRAFFQTDRTSAVHQFKKLVPILFNTINGNIFKKIISILYIKFNFNKIIDFMHNGMRISLLEEKYYSEPVFEIYKNIKNEKLRDVICAILQFDLAYRYRLQDILMEIDKDDFEKRPIREINRLIKIFIERSGDKLLDVKGIKSQYIKIGLILNPSIVKEIKEFVRNIDIGKVMLSKEDWYWCCRQYKEYYFKGIKDRYILYLNQKND